MRIKRPSLLFGGMVRKTVPLLQAEPDADLFEKLAILIEDDPTGTYNKYVNPVVRLRHLSSSYRWLYDFSGIPELSKSIEFFGYAYDPQYQDVREPEELARISDGTLEEDEDDASTQVIDQIPDRR